MTAATTVPTRLPDGVTVSTHGSCVLSGPALAWLHRLDRAVADIAAGWGATAHQFPPLVPAADLDRMGYFTAFPHLVTMPATLPGDEAEVQRFVDGYALGADGSVSVDRLAPMRHALTPAACYPVYAMLREHRTDRPVLVTTAATCYRREERFEPLRRQWAFTMREIVCVGTAAEVREFLNSGRAAVDALRERLGVPGPWEVATDPFFRPQRSGAHLMQQLDPVKHEALAGTLAIASVNLHHDHFGAAFEIGRGEAAAHTGCVAFGLERWLGVVADRWGPDPRRWPDPAEGSDD
ncbi:aminoacyl--tRNA ligase-related protein [Krasilnikovia sp. MM14-A1259]|uniref:aminoacyl--tRNA ligase-related protein n=1 Tax=Krasilnikovia sp. MM14-A1259 TaxID=3373539 RepID=UPI0037FF98C0